jgi:aryl sulfotransferase
MVRPASREILQWVVDSRRWDEYRPRREDIVIVTPPKCGTTWMQQIVCSLVFQTAEPRPLSVSVWIDCRFRQSLEDTLATIEAQTHRRFLKAHQALDSMPLHDEVKYVCVARDGRDAALSYHNHLPGFADQMLATLDRIGLDDARIGKPFPRAEGDPRAFFRRWMEGGAGSFDATEYFRLFNSYWAERHRPNVLLVNYADLKADLDGEMRRVADFLGIETPAALWPDLVDAARFESMREHGPQLMPAAGALWKDGTNTFINKGQVGRWREVLTEQDSADYEAAAARAMAPDLRDWVANGRLAAAPAARRHTTPGR